MVSVDRSVPSVLLPPSYLPLMQTMYWLVVADVSMCAFGGRDDDNNVSSSGLCAAGFLPFLITRPVRCV